MSKDINSLKNCEHVIYKDTLLLGQDLRSIRFYFPPAKVHSLYIEGKKVPRKEYAFVSDTLSEDPRKKMIKLHQDYTWDTPFIQSTYEVDKAFCPICFGKEVVFDWKVFNGKVSLVEETKKLVLDCIRLALTAIGSNVYHTWMGNSAIKHLGDKANIPEAVIRDEVYSSLIKIRELQYQQALIQEVSTKEFLFDIEKVSVNYSNRTYDVTVLVTVGSMDPVSVYFPMKRYI